MRGSKQVFPGSGSRAEGVMYTAHSDAVAPSTQNSPPGPLAAPQARRTSDDPLVAGSARFGAWAVVAVEGNDGRQWVARGNSNRDTTGCLAPVWTSSARVR